jgi:hypothetical protein
MTKNKYTFIDMFASVDEFYTAMCRVGASTLWLTNK